MRYTDLPTSDGRGGRATPFLRGFFGCDVPGEIILNVGVGGHPIRYPLSVWFSPRAAECRAEENRALSSVVPVNGQFCPWYGVVVVLKYGGRRCTNYIDITPRDLMIFSAFISDVAGDRP